MPTDTGFAPAHSPLSFAKKIRGGGFDSEANDGIVPGTIWHPEGWPQPLDISDQLDEPDDPRCVVNGHCAVGTERARSFAGLRVPSNPNPNPDETSENDAVSTHFAVLSTTNFTSEITGVVIPTNQSAIRRSFALPPGRWQLLVDLAFLTGEKGAMAQNDWAAITIKSLTSGRGPVELIRLEADDPLEWKPPPGCGSSAFGSDTVRSNYPLCTDWTPYSVNVSQFAGHEVEVEIRVSEGGPDNRIATSLAVDNLKFNFLPAVRPIRFSQQPGRGETLVYVRTELADSDATDTHRAVWNWGDGTRTSGAITRVGGLGLIRNRHTYSRPGIYTITLTVTDIDGGVGRTRRRIIIR